MKSKSILATIIFLTFILTPIHLFSQESDIQITDDGYPIIKKLANKLDETYTDSHGMVRHKDNVVFKQYQAEVQQASIDISTGVPPYNNYYAYTCKKGDTLMNIYTRCSISYDSIATLNGLEGGLTEDLNGKTLLLPTVNGLYIPLKSRTNVDIILAKEFSEPLLSGEYPKVSIAGKEFYFMQNKRFTQAQRAYFFDTNMRLPLDKSVLTSSFGMRKSPISGKWIFHKGIDMAAPLKSPVYAVKAGSVTSFKKNDTVYGNCVTVKHSGGLSTLYAHMGEVLVKKGESVSVGQVIGKVGMTGMTTGPHLHFEVHDNGEAKDPQIYLTDYK